MKRSRFSEEQIIALLKEQESGVFSAVRNLFVPPRSRRSILSTHLHRLDAMANWKAVAGVTS